MEYIPVSFPTFCLDLVGGTFQYVYLQQCSNLSAHGGYGHIDNWYNFDLLYQ